MATFGNVNIGVNKAFRWADAKIGSRYYLSEEGDISSINAYTNTSAAVAPTRVAIYSDVDGAPGTLLGGSEEVLVGNVWAWHNFPFTTPIRLAPGYYWLTMLSNESNFYFTYDIGEVNQWVQRYDAYPGFLDPWGDIIDEWQPWAMSIYATYTPTVPPPTHILSVNTTPITSVVFTVREETEMSYVTPWSGTLEEGTYVIEMPASVQVGIDRYNFKQWEDGLTNPARTINLLADMTLTATYELAPVAYGDLRITIVNVPANANVTVKVNSYQQTRVGPGDLVFTGIYAKSYTCTVIVDTTQKSIPVTVQPNVETPYTVDMTPPTPCFVATVAYGSNLAPELSTLRRFRDKCLPDALVAVYYCVGTQVASWIKDRKAVKRYIREVLNLLVRLLKKGVME